MPYNNNYQPVHNIPIVTGATSWTDQNTGEVFILIIHEAIYFGNKLSHSLLNPNQLRHFGIKVQDNPFNTTEPMSITADNDKINIPLTSQGVDIFFETCTPSRKELQRC